VSHTGELVTRIAGKTEVFLLLIKYLLRAFAFKLLAGYRWCRYTFNQSICGPAIRYFGIVTDRSECVVKRYKVSFQIIGSRMRFQQKQSEHLVGQTIDVQGSEEQDR
jgi:hypothetical protein